jgi:uncharacterized Zn ribbon protein
MRVILLANRFPNGFNLETNGDEARENLEEFEAVYDAINAGTACVRFLDGDRKGSVARLAFGDGTKEPKRPEICHAYSHSRSYNITHRIENAYLRCVATWDGRRNKVQVTLPNYYEAAEILIDYDGPTVWEKFDTKAAKDAILKNPDQKDINGKVLSVGDTVLYINARYGSRMTLDEGTVVEFLASVNSKAHTIATVIESKTGEQSSLQYPESMVYKFG